MFKIIRTKTRRTIFICLIYGFILAVLYVFVARSISGYSESLKTKLHLQSEKIKEYERLIKAYPNPEKEIENIEKKIQELRDKAASREQIPRIIQQLARKTSELNINVISIKPLEDIKISEEKLIEGVSKAYVEVVMLTSYRSVGDYLEALAGMPIILSVENFSVEKEHKGFARAAASKSNELFVTLLLSAYMILEI